MGIQRGLREEEEGSQRMLVLQTVEHGISSRGGLRDLLRIGRV